MSIVTPEILHDSAITMMLLYELLQYEGSACTQSRMTAERQYLRRIHVFPFGP